ncbi:MAG: hypothetical protein AVDCRST_MAG25-390, partial [uncultured Rubrobacteraceae bacterium]
ERTHQAQAPRHGHWRLLGALPFLRLVALRPLRPPSRGRIRRGSGRGDPARGGSAPRHRCRVPRLHDLRPDAGADGANALIRRLRVSRGGERPRVARGGLGLRRSHLRRGGDPERAAHPGLPPWHGAGKHRARAGRDRPALAGPGRPFRLGLL